MEEKEPLEKLKSTLEHYRSLGCETCKKEAATCVGWHMFAATIKAIGKIFLRTENKEAEKILAELLDSESAGVGYLAFLDLRQAENKGKKLSEETEKEIKEFKRDPRNWGICKVVDQRLKASKASTN